MNEQGKGKGKGKASDLQNQTTAFHSVPHRIPTLLSVYAIAGGSASLLGWVLDKQSLTDWFGGGLSTQPNTAVAVILGGCALVLLSARRNLLAAILGTLAGLIGLITLFEYGSGVDLGIDSLLMFDRQWGRTATTNPGRMGFPAGVSWTLLGAAFLCARGGDSMRQLASLIGLSVALIATLSLIGYVFGADTLYTLPAVTAIAFQTATFLLALSVGLVVSMRDSEPMRTLLAPTGAGLLARRALPFIVLVPLVVGYLRQRGEFFGLYDSQFGTALRTSVEIALLTLMLWWTVRTVRHREIEIEATGEILRRSERELSDFFENASVGLHWVGPDGTILRVNKAELDLLGYSSEEYVRRHIADFHVSEPTINDILDRLGRGEILQEYPAQMRCKDGRVLDVLIDSSVLFNNDEFVHTRCFTRDVTKQRQAEQALRDADRRKDEFLATLAHELRNPLAPIANSLQLMKYAGSDANIVNESRAIAERQVEHMVRLIDDLLDLSRITRNKLELRNESVDLAEVVNAAVASCRDMIEKNGHTLNASANQPIFIDADPVRITQVVTNLLNNASKFTKAGGTISVAVESDGDRATISVKDTGIGIPEEMLDKVFEMFTQVDRSLERTQGGLGIGLSLTKLLVELHGGSISVLNNGSGTGSEFVVELPVAAGEEEVRTTSSPVHHPPVKRRILVVDDNADSAESLAILLKLQGNDTMVARDGLDALEKGAAYNPDVILLDIGMPGMNGYDACEAIRAERWGKDLLLIAMTGWGQEEDRRRSAAAGFDHHLVKPINHPQLLELLAFGPAPEYLQRNDSLVQ
ncbi:MAG: ATP-binding protein [Pyrinomonadaceae bacterium]